MMSDSGSLSPVPTSTKKRKKAPGVSFDRGEPRTTPCRECVKRQLKTFQKDGWKDTCCDQKTENGKASSCYQCRIAGRKCPTFDVDDPAIRKWAEVQSQPSKYDRDEALKAAANVKLYIMRTFDPLTPLEKSFCHALKTMSESANNTMAPVLDLVRNNLAFVDDDEELDPDLQAKLDKLSKCRKLEDALPLAEKIISAALDEINQCAQDARSKM